MTLTGFGEERRCRYRKRRLIGGPCDGHEILVPTPAPPGWRCWPPRMPPVLYEPDQPITPESTPRQEAFYRRGTDGHYHFEPAR